MSKSLKALGVLAGVLVLTATSLMLFRRDLAGPLSSSMPLQSNGNDSGAILLSPEELDLAPAASESGTLSIPRVADSGGSAVVDQIDLPGNSLDEEAKKRIAGQVAVAKEATRCLRLRLRDAPLASCSEDSLQYTIDQVILMLDDAARSGDLDAMVAYGYAFDAKYPTYKDIVLNRDLSGRMLAKNLNYLQRAAKSGSADAMYRLHVAYQNGLYEDRNGVYAAAYMIALSRAEPGNSSFAMTAQDLVDAMAPQDAAEAQRLSEQVPGPNQR